MTSQELYALLEIPEAVRVQFEVWDRERKMVVDDALYDRVLHRDTWSDAVKEWRARLGEDPDGIAILWEMLKKALVSFEEYRKRGIGQDIFQATMRFSTRYLNDALKQTGRYQFIAPWWFPRELSLVEFRVGTLEYEFFEENGNRMIQIHIPSDADLSPVSLDASLEAFENFRKTFFPEWMTAPRVCNSWMMSPALPQLLPPTSRILGFQRRFTLRNWDRETNGVLNWVFPGHKEISEALPENTSLQRSMKAYLLRGEPVGWAEAVMNEDMGRGTDGEDRSC
ncbi:MAG: DUF5596 domain-containing protein [Clostridia bacterium]|nr:DUF5596 domain-containing protein [Clostridia bacterium]